MIERLTERLGLFLFVMLTSHSLGLGLNSRLYVWNVGQGQWITWISEEVCRHFDMGGEQAPKNRIRRLCGEKRNELFLSHADEDHIRFIPWARKNLNGMCLHALPRENLAPAKKSMLLSLPKCKTVRDELVREISRSFVRSGGLKANDLSLVHILSIGRSVLIPGDSTAKAEALWSRAPDGISKVRILIVGHHGSATSTSETLLSRMSSLRQALVSARKKRYGHPHRLVRARLRSQRIALITTEVWGHISLEL